MNASFDDLARNIARGASRRDVLRRLGAGLAGVVLASLGFKRARTAILSPTCGTCQACDADMNVCGGPCNPASTAQTLCTQAGNDGSYLRLANYLTANGFVSAGASDSVMFSASGVLFGTVLTTNFQNTATPSNTATIGYAVSPAGNISASALVFQNGVARYVLGVDANGRVFTTIVTSTSGTSPASERARNAIPNAPSVIPPATCERVVDIVCGVVLFGAAICGPAVDAICVAAFIEAADIPAPACIATFNVLCGLLSYAACEASKSRICECPPGQQLCNGVCCDFCMDCLDGQCVPNTTCASNNTGPCCGNQCCQSNFTCDTTQNPPVCMSPHEECAGATCSTFVPCSSANPDCVCGTIAEGGGLCVPGSTQCASLATCSSSADCGPDALCTIGSCCDEPVCVPISLSSQCPEGTAVRPSGSRPAANGKGPTIGHR
jgi:hypothetical protein